MKDYSRSICSTCSHAPYCSLTTDMSSISSCSEYVHHLDREDGPSIMVSAEMVGGIPGPKIRETINKQEELVLN